MQKHKVVESVEIEADQLEWLKDMAASYQLADVSKALRVVLDYAMMDLDEDDIFGVIRCRRCG
ncbi:MAG TPA: hypothetical protein VF342_03945 [Alphaproteobacteria bacterium]